MSEGGVIKAGSTAWRKGGMDISKGALVLTEDSLEFSGHAPQTVGTGVGDALADKVLDSSYADKEHSFVIPLERIQAVRKPAGRLAFGGMEVVTGERNYRLDGRRKWSQPIREAVEARGISVGDDPSGNGWRVA